ncbi:MAG: DUF4230 domain-containing protein [Oscillospiraceae bacterium]|nr:DUF4230 domain-containing protein [Oscillospiraceae bacterium]
MNPQTDADREERLRRARALADELSAEARGEVYLSELTRPRPSAKSPAQQAKAGAGDELAKTRVFDKSALIAQSLRAADAAPAQTAAPAAADAAAPAQETAAKPSLTEPRQDKPKKEKKRRRVRLPFLRFLVRLICLLVILYALANVADRFTSLDLMGTIKDACATAKEKIEVMLGLQPEITVADYQSVVLIEARKQQQLIVYEKDVSVQSELSQSLLDLDVFKKTKSVRSYATGYYTVDLASLSESNVTYDPETKTVSLTVPATKLYVVDFDPTKSQFEETEKGLLAFGDIKLTSEEQAAFEASVKQTLTDALSTDACFREADDAALEALGKLFTPLVQGVDEEATVKIYFSKA